MSNAVALRRPTESYERAPISFTHEEVSRLNRATRARLEREGNVRIQLAYFRCPWPCTKAQYERVRTAAVKRWIGYMEKTGWVLASAVKCRVDRRKAATTLSGDWYSVPSLDEVEIPVAAAFKKLDLQIIRTEVLVSD